MSSETKTITIELDEPILTEDGCNMHEVLLMDENKQLRHLLDEMQRVVRNGVQFWNSRTYRDASDSLLKRIDEALNEKTRTP